MDTRIVNHVPLNRCPTRRTAAAAAILSLAWGASCPAQTPWPAETWSGATNLTPVEGAGTNDFHEDLSGAFWNPTTRRLWLCRNGPAATTSKFWALVESGGTFAVDQRSGQRGEWTNFGDLEAITQVNLSEDKVYLMIETDERIRCFSTAVYGTATLLRDWNTSAFLPLSGGSGAEALAFVPDYHLARWGFVDPAGAPRLSTRGMGGLMFVGHQNGGRVYAFDLSPTSNAFDFVGSYTTGYTETAELSFDRSSGLLYILHGDGANTIEVTTLASTPVGGSRRLNEVLTYSPPAGAPAGANIEGFTTFGFANCSMPPASGSRSAFLTIDDGGATSLLWFRQFSCLRPWCPADYDADGAAQPADVAAFIGAWSGSLAAGNLAGDYNADWVVNPADVATFVAEWFATVAGGCGV